MNMTGQCVAVAGKCGLAHCALYYVYTKVHHTHTHTHQHWPVMFIMYYVLLYTTVYVVQTDFSCQK